MQAGNRQRKFARMALSAVVAVIAAIGLQAAPAMATTGGTSSTGGSGSSSHGGRGEPCYTNRSHAIIISRGKACAPKSAPSAVKRVIQAANAIRNKPYKYGGGHGSWNDSGYDCSGAVSYALHGGGLLGSPRDSSGLAHYGKRGNGRWISVFGNSGHAYMKVAGLRWDTSGTGGSGPSWHSSMRSSRGYSVRHPAHY